MRLYHGSKNGLSGAIRPISRDRCDFGRGFYMGTERSQPLTLICNFPHPMLYTLELDVAGLDTLKLPADTDWALFVAFNRGKLEQTRGTPLYQRVSQIAADADIVAGPIANDRMFVVLDRFFRGEITNVALVHCLSALQLGDQYVAVTQKACERVRITEEHALSEGERQALLTESERNRAEGIALAERICREYRREGRFFDEILEDGA